jgi:TP901 family phage tail tape measure protein
MAFERAAYLEAVIGADITQFRKAMRDVRNDLGLFAEEGTNKLQSFGRDMTYLVTVPLLSVGSAAVETASLFESNMRNVNSMAQLNEQGFRDMSAAVLDWGSQTTFGANKASEALYGIISAGYTDLPKAMEVMMQSTKLAEATQADLMGTTDALTAVMLSYAGSNMTAAEAADVMARITQMGVGEQNDYNRTMQKTLPLAVALGIAYDDLGAVQAVVSQNGSGLDKAGTSVAMMMSNLLKPTAALTEGLETLGVSTGRELIDKFGGVAEAVAALRANSSEIDFAKMFSKTGLEAAFTLTNNLDVTNAKLLEFKSSITGAVDASRGEQMKSFAFQMQLLKSAVEGAAIVIGEVLIPALLPLVHGISDVFTSIRTANPEIVKLGVVLGVVAAALPPIIWALGTLLSPIGLVIGGVVALVAAFQNDFMGITTAVENAIKPILPQLRALGDAVSVFMDTLFPDAPDLSWMDNLVPSASDFAGIFEPFQIPANQVVEVQEGDTLWSIWANDFADLMTWDEFKKAAGYEKGFTIKPGDILQIAGGLESTISAGAIIVPGAAALARLLVPQPIQLAADMLATAPPVSEWVANMFPQESIFSRLQTAAQEFIPKLITILGQIVTAGIAWLDTQAGLGISFVAGLFEAGNGSGDTPVYTAFKALLEGDLWAAIDAIIPGLGTKIGDMLSGAVNSVEDGTMQSAAATAMGSLLSNMATWLETEAAPTISRALGYAIGRAGSGISQGLQDLVAGIGQGDAGLGNTM